MNIEKMKTRISVLTLILTLTLSAIIVFAPTAAAQNEGVEVDPWVYVNAVPNPNQVNQITLVHIGSEWPGPNVDVGWIGLTVEVTRPDGTKFTLGPVNTDSTGGTATTFTPTQVGTYTLVGIFPEQIVPQGGEGGFVVVPPNGATMVESTTEPLELVVQEEPIQHFPTQPLPNYYWTRPIDEQLWNWRSITGNYLGYWSTMDSPAIDHSQLYGDGNEDAPNTAHILWAKPITMGGLAGRPLSEPWGFEESDAYEPKFTGTVVLGGILFYNEFESTGSETGLERNVIAVDLRTGEELWHKPLVDLDGNNRNLDFGQLFMWDSYNYHGVFPYLWTVAGSTWNAYDAFTGRWEYTMQGVPSGTRVIGDKGEIFIYTFNLNDGWMTFWNSSRVVADRGSWRPHGRVYDREDVMDGIEWNVTIPTDLPGTVDEVRGNIALGTDFDKYLRSEDYLSMWALNIDPDSMQCGQLLYNRTWATPINFGHYDVQDANAEEDVFTVSCGQTRTHWGFRLSTGMEIWGPTEPQHYTDKWGYTSSNSWDLIYYGKYFTGNYGGVLRCFDVQTGELLWATEITDYYAENLHNNAWRFRPFFFADGKIYIENTEHNPFNPQHRQAPTVAIDVETGDEVFRIPYRSSEWSSTTFIADSIMVSFNTYDLRVYAVGKGPSEVTVEAPLQASEWGQEIILRGRVNDISPGTQTAAMKMRFPNGVPAVSDAHMTDWMLYVYNQFGMPMASGVPVKLEVVVDPNGNWYDIGTAYTDASGFYSIAWEPPVPGAYLILASFEGSESYYPSYIETAVIVDEGLTPGSFMESDLLTSTGSDKIAQTPLISNEIAILAGIAVFSLIGLAAFAFLRKEE